MKLEYKNVKLIDSYDLDKFIEKIYGKIYCFQQQDDCKNRGIEFINVPVDDPYDYKNESIPEVINGKKMGVSFKAWLKRDINSSLNPTNEELQDSIYYWEKDNKKEWCKNKSHISLFWQRNFYPSIDMIMNDLYEKGLIESGEYIINIDW